MVLIEDCRAQYFSKYDGTPWLVQVNGGMASFQNYTSSYFVPVVGSVALKYSVTDKLALLGMAECSMFSDALVNMSIYSFSIGPNLNMARIVNINDLGAWIWNIYGTLGAFSSDIQDNGLVFNFGSDFGYWVNKKIGIIASIKSSMLMMGDPKLLSKIGRSQQVFSLGFVIAIGSSKGHVDYNY